MQQPTLWSDAFLEERGGGDFDDEDKDDNDDNARASVLSCHRLDDMRHVDEGDVGWVCW